MWPKRPLESLGPKNQAEIWWRFLIPVSRYAYMHFHPGIASLQADPDTPFLFKSIQIQPQVHFKVNTFIFKQ